MAKLYYPHDDQVLAKVRAKAAILRASRKAAGLCPTCATPREPGVACQPCKAKGDANRRKYYSPRISKASTPRAEYARRRRELRRSNGLCQNCGKNKVENRVICRDCSERSRVSAEKRRRLMNPDVRPRGQRKVEWARERGLCACCGKNPQGQLRKIGARMLEWCSDCEYSRWVSTRVADYATAEQIRSLPHLCEICGDTNLEKLRIDHNHATGLLRGMLCEQCNLGLGQFRDNPDLTLKATRYLNIRNAASFWTKDQAEAIASNQALECGPSA